MEGINDWMRAKTFPEGSFLEIGSHSGDVRVLPGLGEND
jgi:hypothetical protein